MLLKAVWDVSGYVLKAADAELTVALDWRQGYLDPAEMLSENLGWYVVPAGEVASDLTVAAQGLGDRRSWAAFSGGAQNSVYMVSARVRTDRNRILERAIVVRIAAA